MRTHNHLLGNVPGCDGLKTGYFTEAGYSIAATVQRDGARVVTVVMGSVDRKTRDDKATELLARGLLDATRAPAAPAPAPVAQPAPAPAPDAAAPAVTADDETQGEDLPDAAPAAGEKPAPAEKSGGWLKNVGLVLLGAFIAAVIGMVVQRRLLLSR